MAAAAAGTNSNCFQVEIVGKDTEMLLANKEQTKAVVRLVKELSEKYKIPLNNERIESLRGVYSHTQAKKNGEVPSILTERILIRANLI